MSNRKSIAVITLASVAVFLQTGVLQGQNLTDEPLRFYSGDKSRLAENEFYSWNAMLGVQVKF